MSFDFAGSVKSDFEDFMLADLGETVSYSGYSSTPTFSTASASEVDGYLLSIGSPTATDVSVIIATFTQKDIQMFDLGNLSVDDHKVFIPSSTVPGERDRFTRGDNEIYEVISVLHEHAIGGTVGFYTCHCRRRRT